MTRASADVDVTRRDYDQWAQAYDDFVRDPETTDPVTTGQIDVFAELVRATGSAAPVLDAGCGPGQWTDHLDRRGVAARGLDLSPAMIAIARGRRPDLRFDVGSVLELDLPDDSVAGVLAHFSLIHTPPAHVPTALAEFARVLVPGGHLLVAGQSGDDITGADGWLGYDHRVSPAYRWTVAALAAAVRAAGFVETARTFVQPPGPRTRFPAAYVLGRTPG